MKKLTDLQFCGLVMIPIILLSIAFSFLAINERIQIIKKYNVILTVNNFKIKKINELSKEAHVISRNLVILNLIKDLNEIKIQKLKIAELVNSYLSEWEMILPYGICQSNEPLKNSIVMAQRNSINLSSKIAQLTQSRKSSEANDMLLKTLVPITINWQLDFDKCLKIEESYNATLIQEAALSDSRLEKILITLSLLVCPVLLFLLFIFAKRELMTNNKST